MIRKISARLLILLAGCGWFALDPEPVCAAGTASYYLAITEDNDVAHLSAAAAANAPGAVDALHMAEMYAMWKTQQELLAFRDYPYFEITNTSTNAAAINHFRIAIDASRPYNFDTVFYVEASPGITYNITGPDTIQNGARADFIDLTFTGFTPDKFFRFRSDIDNDSGNVNFFTDYRTVLTDAGGMNPASTNALVTVDLTGTSFSDRIGGGQLMGPFFTGTNFQSYHGIDMVQPYVIGNANVNPVPEPTSWLALGSLVGAAGIYLRRRKPLDS